MGQPLKDKQGQLLKGNLSLLLLAILQSQPAHGYAVIRELERRSHGAFDLAEGTVYPALYRLEKQGLLESRRAAVDGRERRVYSLTAKGQAALGEDVKVWHHFAQGMSAVLEGAR
ncbi:MAG: PadR family transcriptional regulator [Actinobacteria bacterium]|nr:PadR family transcriptional regulator [Actinomycetota bacterium]